MKLYKLYSGVMYGTAQLQLHFYTREHAWCHAVFHVLIPKIAVEIHISTRRDVALPRVVFTRDRRGIYTRWKRDISTRRVSAH